MKNSAHFLAMNKRLKELRRHFLPKKFSPTGQYSERSHDLVSAYKVLVHAEIEHYIETICKEIAILKVKDWKNSGKTSKVLISFLISYHKGWSIGPAKGSTCICGTTAKSCKSLVEAIDCALNQYISNIIETNHGVKQDNIRCIVEPMGIDLSCLDSTWLNSMNSFGAARGEIAHKSKAKQKNKLDPKGELDNVGLLLIGLNDLDEKLMAIMN